MVQYQMAKVAITGPGKPFWGWVKSDTGYNGILVPTASSGEREARP